ncbi:hypothetical protein B0H10DRAFT_1944664 [Mycena sp. CBHHK59/15]|nr:hypothetical protein B0H10DRAFT_1944664 [Mycena sp. CBHHK59/15]
MFLAWLEAKKPRSQSRAWSSQAKPKSWLEVGFGFWLRVRKAKAKGLSRGFEQGKKTPEEGRQNFWDGRASSRNDIQMHPIKPNSFRTHTMLPDMQRKILVKPGFGQSQVKPIPAAGLWLWLDPRWAKARGL